MYVVKVGEYYVKSYSSWDRVVMLSQEIMRGFDKDTAVKLAEKLKAELIELTEEVTNG